MAKKRIVPNIAPSLQSMAVAMDSIVFDPANARKHGDDNMTAIVASLQKFGQVKPIIVREATRHIVAGNGTYAAALKLGWKEIAANILPLSEAEARQYAIADNRTAELAEWDQDILLQQIDLISQEDQDFSDALFLNELLPAPKADELPAVEVPAIYGINIDCGNEETQKQLYDELKRRKFTVKLVTM
jgi:ParB-like chromosome segregation protein Spo0J